MHDYMYDGRNDDGDLDSCKKIIVHAPFISPTIFSLLYGSPTLSL